MVERLFLAVPRGCLQFVIVVFPDHTHLLFFMLLLVIVVCCCPIMYGVLRLVLVLRYSSLCPFLFCNYLADEES